MEEKPQPGLPKMNAKHGTNDQLVLKDAILVGLAESLGCHVLSPATYGSSKREETVPPV